MSVDGSGLAPMLEELVRQNLERIPSRRRLLRPATIVIEVPDAEVTVTLHVDRGGFRAVDGDDPMAPVRIRTDAHDLLALARVPLVAGLPDPRRREGRAVLAAIVTGRLRVGGLATHLPTVARLTALLSAR